VTPLPRWDLSAAFPGADSPELEAGCAAAVAAVTDLAALFDRHGVGTGGGSEVRPAGFEEVLAAYDAALERTSILSSYLSLLLAADSRDAAARARSGELQPSLVALEQLGARFTRWAGALDLSGLETRSAAAREHTYQIERARERARHLMSPGEEALTAELRTSPAWARLYRDVASRMMVALERDGRRVRLPMSAVRNLGYDPDRDLRRRAHEAELRAWPEVAPPVAAALNGLKHEASVLARRRGWGSALEESLFLNGIDRATLDAMLTAVRERIPGFRRYFRLKARALGVERLAWYDLFAPVGSAGRSWEYGEATSFILRGFGAYSDRLRDFAARAFRENWIDAEPRPGKSVVSFCDRLRPGEPRILVNYEPSFTGMIILAHELGHGYHEFRLGGRTASSRVTPETLAETASIFCETLVRRAALPEAGPDEEIAILEDSLQGSAQRVLAMTGRFHFEERVFEGRRKRELSADELCALMIETQRETYGDALDPDTLHPYLWAAKAPLFQADLAFYNYPYVFGLLFARGLYARYREDPGTFRSDYDALLSDTGSADAATLAARFGIDIHTPGFWRDGLAEIDAEIDRYEELVG
jgi:pepF/M3 family oligoendopeptidase